MRSVTMAVMIIFILLTAGCDWEEDRDSETVEVQIFFGCPEAIESGEPGVYGMVTPVSREITHTGDILRATLEELIKGPHADEDLYPVVPSTVNILSINVEEKIAVIDLCQEMFGDEWTGGTLGGTVFVQAFIKTAAQFPEVSKVQVLVEGEYWDDGHIIWDEALTAHQAIVEALPAEIIRWVDYSRQLFLAQAREYEDLLYILVTYGEKPTGGYRVDISKIAEEDGSLNVTVNFSDPGEENVTQVFTYPYDLEIIESPGLPVEFQAEGDRSFVPMLKGLDWLPPLAAGSEDIRIISPDRETVPREFTLEGIELVFEGTVIYRILDKDGVELDRGFTTGHGYDWGYFVQDIVVPEEIRSGEEFLLEVYSESAKDGSIENLVRLEIALQ